MPAVRPDIAESGPWPMSTPTAICSSAYWPSRTTSSNATRCSTPSADGCTTVPYRLGQILCDRALGLDGTGLLQALVAKHLEKFGNDPGMSLQPFSSIGSVCEDLSRIADAELHASLARVSAAPADNPFRTITRRAWAIRVPAATDSASSALMPGAGWVRSRWRLTGELGRRGRPDRRGRAGSNWRLGR